MIDLLIIFTGLCGISYSLVISHRRLPPSHLLRLPLFGVLSCVAVGGVWLRVLPIMGLSLPSPAEQILAISLTTLVLRWGMQFMPEAKR